MKKENIAIEIVQFLEKYLVRAERFNEVLSKNLAKLEIQKEGMSESLLKVTLEVEELKKTREKLSSVLSEKIKEAYVEESKTFNDQLLTSFIEKVDQDMNTAKNIIMGKVAWENFGKLISKDHDILEEGIKRHMLSGK